MSKIKASIKILLFFMLCGVIVPMQLIVLLCCKGRAAYQLTHIWHCGVCKIFGLKVLVKGDPASRGRTVFCSNHVSYLDIPVIGSVLKASFVAKSEVEAWPLIGGLSKLQQTVFISRRRQDIEQGAARIMQSFDQGKNIILFPEGTSTDGINVSKVKGAMLTPLLGLKDVFLQPFTLRIVSADGQHVCANRPNNPLRDLYAWYADMELVPHLWNFARSKGAVIELTFHAPIDVAKYDDRKALASACEEKITIPLVTAQEFDKNLSSTS